MKLGRGPLGDVLAILGTFALVGVLGGALWWLLVDPAEFTKDREGGAMSEVELAGRFAADGWYAVIAAVAGFLLGLGLTWWRTRDFRLTTVLVVVGSALAAWIMATVGGALGPDDTEAALEGARQGEMVPVELTVSAVPFYLMWPMGALVGALMVLWSVPGVDLPREPVPGRSMQDRDPEDRDDLESRAP
ncbi:MAG TPA: hypothetical protein VFZ64_15780 [Nocardioidaceae bacterium]